MEECNKQHVCTSEIHSRKELGKKVSGKMELGKKVLGKMELGKKVSGTTEDKLAGSMKVEYRMAPGRMVGTILDKLVSTLRLRTCFAPGRKWRLLHQHDKHRKNSQLPSSQSCMLVRRMVVWGSKMQCTPRPCGPLHVLGFLSTRRLDSKMDIVERKCCSLDRMRVRDTAVATVVSTRIFQEESSGIRQPSN